MPCPRVKTGTDFHERALVHELPEGPTDLVIAAEVVKIGAQEYVAPLALDPLGHLAFRGSLSCCQSTTFEAAHSACL